MAKIKRAGIALMVLLILLVLSLHAYSQSTLLTAKLDPATLKALLSRGQLILLEEKGGRIKYRTCAMLINAKLDKVFNAIIDFKHYPDFVPEMQRVKVLYKKGNKIKAEFVVGFKFMGIGTTKKYTQTYILKKPNKIIIYDDKGKKSGYWYLMKAAGGKKTMAFYSDIAPRIEDLGSLVKFLVKQKPAMELALQVSPPSMLVKAIKQRAEKKK